MNGPVVHEKVAARMSLIKHKLLVLSGKGGVGKSTVASGLACSLVQRGFKVGLLDVDICGPSIPRLFGLERASIVQCDEGWVPLYADKSQNLKVMSIGFMLDTPDTAVVWRGPKKTAMIRQFLQDVFWGELDYLVIDTPPGTSDEHMSLAEFLAGCGVDGAVLVTTPQQVAVADVRKEISFCRKVSLPILGVVENMSGYVCPHCDCGTDIFLSGGGEKLAAEAEVPFLGRLPIEPKIATAMDAGLSFVEVLGTSVTGNAFQSIINAILVQETKAIPQ